MYKSILTLMVSIALIGISTLSAAQKKINSNTVQILSVKDVDTPPVLIKSVTPEYPEIALKNRIEGKVILNVIINSNGHVKHVKVLKSTNSIFNKAAIKAVYQYVFKPAEKNGKKVAVSIVLPVVFHLR